MDREKALWEGGWSWVEERHLNLRRGLRVALNWGNSGSVKSLLKSHKIKPSSQTWDIEWQNRTRCAPLLSLLPILTLSLFPSFLLPLFLFLSLSPATVWIWVLPQACVRSYVFIVAKWGGGAFKGRILEWGHQITGHLFPQSLNIILQALQPVLASHLTKRSFPAWASALTSSDGEQWCEGVRKINPFLPKRLWL